MYSCCRFVSVVATPTQALPPYHSRVRSHELSLAREFDNMRVSVDLEPQCPKPAAGPALRHCPSGWALERASLPGLALEHPGLPGLALKNDEDDSGEKQ